MRVVQKALTFDDVLLLPAHSRVLPREVSLKTRLTRKLELNIPLVSAAMDTVTEARLAIAIAQEGGIGIVHKNLTPQAQAAEVAKVKRFESRRAARPDDHHARDDGARGDGAAARAQDLRLPGGEERQGGRHRHQPRPALRDQARPAGEGDHDAAATSWSRCAKARAARKRCELHAPAPPRARAGGRRRVPPARA